MCKKITKKGEKIRNSILNLFKKEKDLSFKVIFSKIGKTLGISENGLRKHIDKLVEQKLLNVRKEGKNNIYTPCPSVKKKFTFDSNNSLITDEKVWIDYIFPNLSNIGHSAKEILNYAFTEMFDNVISHAKASKIDVNLCVDPIQTYITVSDNGIGIFKKIKDDLNLQDDHQSLLELSKGKFTSNPKEHSGEGIFFTSKACDLFAIFSGNLFYSLSQKSDIGAFVEMENSNSSGTTVFMAVNNNTSRSLKKVFDTFTSSTEDRSFSKTIVPVKLLRYKDEGIISRSQARRLLARFDKFKYVILDFSGIDSIGQAFADEIFRVYVNAHPEITLTYRNANQSIKNMISHVN